MKLIPGKKVSSNCRMKIMQMINASERAISSSDSEIESFELEMVGGNALMTLNESFHNLSETPIKLQEIKLPLPVESAMNKEN